MLYQLNQKPIPKDIQQILRSSKDFSELQKILHTCLPDPKLLDMLVAIFDGRLSKVRSLNTHQKELNEDAK